MSANEVQSYLDRHFVSLEQLAPAAGETPSAARDLVEAGCVPRPSYVVSGDGALATAVFGRLPGSAQLPGDYYPPAGAAWIRRAARIRAQAGGDLLEAAAAVSHTFIARYREALREFDDDTDQGDVDALAGEVEGTITHWRSGTYGVCTRHPVDERAIARKQVAQLRLARLANDGHRSAFSQVEVAKLREAMAEYDAAAMPFSPANYPQSSRKRLVDDVLAFLRSHR
jgi:hypothetical protein